MVALLTGICVDHFYPLHFLAGNVVDLFQPRLEVYVCVVHVMYDVDEIFTRLLPFALDQLQDFAHLQGNHMNLSN